MVHSGFGTLKCPSVRPSVLAISPKLLVRFRWNLVHKSSGYCSWSFWGLEPNGETSPWMRRKFQKFVFGWYLIYYWSDLDEILYVKFSGILVVPIEVRNPWGNFPANGGMGKFLKIQIFMKIVMWGPLTPYVCIWEVKTRWGNFPTNGEEISKTSSLAYNSYNIHCISMEFNI